MKLCKEGNGKKEKEKDFWSNGPGGIRPSQLRRVGGRARMRAAQSAHEARTTLGGEPCRDGSPVVPCRCSGSHAAGRSLSMGGELTST
jgi:hypothetical protein